ncbi:transcriptional regulator, LysR family protein [Pseudooceanicola batsensis HTCC2597]|uniref:Transcriptional regulator, LysR family protein n=1 Tax=Pseudooceanicola batsensis (strain ATCC BAA-863 / DSM 15984 / KCTC 12145 / HTCC2597) TaxID=252305 RepID=A3TVT0_PSEBH|nr:LysR family transcriptional regulator [Pseudooceanicola batsensis]EAQ03726.1 transcriptional regulator, LysR family protein [Pseudooceanicola batsensis HTCC2597]
MNWPAASFDWNQARAFLATAELGSLSAAARELGQTQPTLGRQVAALEDQLGVALFDRAGRGLILTEAGRELLSHVREMAEAAARVPLTASGQSQALRGTVGITASDVFSVTLLPPIIAELSRIAPEIEIEVVASNDLRDLSRREADIAIRHVRPTEPALTARLLGEGTGHLYAAPAYLDRRGRPASRSDLATHDFVGFLDVNRMGRTLGEFGIPVAARNIRYRTDNGLAMWEMVRAGLGIGVMTADLGLTTPDVELLFPREVAFRYPIWLVTHRELHSARRIRVVYDHLAQAITTHLRRIEARSPAG